MVNIGQALFIACAGKSIKSLTETGELQAMETVMLGDRIRNRAKEKHEDAREQNVPKHIEAAYHLGKEF